MENIIQNIKHDIEAVANEWLESNHLHLDEVFVIGCSTSEVIGKHIGTSGSEAVASSIFSAMKRLKQTKNVHLAFQCCEHLNRSLVVERETMQVYRLEEVSAVPVPTAGGSMASYAYKHMEDPVVVEYIQASAGIDIGETMIGMHMKHVAVPLRFTQRTIGEARVTGAFSRPKLIGGKRANYENTREKNMK
ncbi:TIGR01440 family protein [Oceanobacillus zhaokaii]|uniref:UPF0340 protein CUC15_17560 n=1 Tax=Oceanobacillus zhaokaii TaxID=2052660 RepID=A0A345PKV4_9BACI|nr:TIGR01440 family protein [Oceanobacillus zhaokaii]AXI10634.1 TIGR01440 family protein [Oceanobacillus zhaokaii]